MRPLTLTSHLDPDCPTAMTLRPFEVAQSASELHHQRTTSQLLLQKEQALRAMSANHVKEVSALKYQQEVAAREAKDKAQQYETSMNALKQENSRLRVEYQERVAATYREVSRWCLIKVCSKSRA